MFFDFVIYQIFKEGTLIRKMSNINDVQYSWNFAQSRKLKNKQVAKIWSLYL
jgi:hypothetical protein